MTEAVATTFSALAVDRPLDNPAHDTLGRIAFADRVATELLAWSRAEPLVVSLDGEPGSGKTTMKNFIRHRLLAASPAAAPVVVDFNPWQRDGGGRLAPDLCVAMADQLQAGGSSSALKELGASWRHLAAALTAGSSSGVGGAAEPAPTTVGNLHLLIGTQLRALSGPVVLFVDDLDLLPAAELQQFTRALQTHAAFPGLICFLLLSPGTLARAPGGPEELRKLVQIELELPDAPEPLLRRELEQGLAAILDTVCFPRRPPERWNEVFASAVWPLFSTPRDVKRFLSSFAFQFAAHFDPGQRVLEVNPIDLVLLETLRMFAHPVYAEVRDAFRRREMRAARLTSGREEDRKAARLELDEVVNTLALSAREKRVVAVALQHLLPPGTGGVHGCREDWDRDLRLCSARHAERYFHLGTAADALPARRLVEIARCAAGRAAMEAALLQSAADDALPEVLERLPPLLDSLGETEVAATSGALCKICDQLPERVPDETPTRLVKFAAELFARLQNPLKRENILAELLEDPARLTGPILLLHQLRPRADAAAGSAITIEQFRRLVKPAVERLQASAADGSIWRSREYGALIRRWWEWTTNRDEVRQWLLEQTMNPEHARAWLRAFVGPSPATQSRELVLQLEELAQFSDPAALAAAAAKSTGDGVDRATNRALAQALSPRGTSPAFALRTLVVKLEDA